jgi:hypothetical protein
MDKIKPFKRKTYTEWKADNALFFQDYKDTQEFGMLEKEEKKAKKGQHKHKVDCNQIDKYRTYRIRLNRPIESENMVGASV